MLKKQWTLELSKGAEEDLDKLDKPVREDVLSFFDKVIKEQDPRNLAVKMKGSYSDFWRFRIGNYRALARLEDQRLVIFTVAIGHRSRIYTIPVSPRRLRSR